MAKTLVIKDKYLKKALQITEGIKSPYTADKLLEVERISWDEDAAIDEGGVKDLSGIEYCKNLKDLELQSSNLTDISNLSQLEKLEEVWLDENYIKDISPLSNKKNLREIHLSGNRGLSDITSLTGLPALTDLDISNTAVSDITHLTNLPALARLNISDTKITDFSVLLNMTSLNEVSLYEKGNLLESDSTFRKIIASLIARGVKVNMRWIEGLVQEVTKQTMVAAQSGDSLEEKLKSLGAMGIAKAIKDIGLNGQLSSEYPNNGNSILHLAVKGEGMNVKDADTHLKVIELLIKEGVPVNLKNKAGYPPLNAYLERKGRDLGIIKMLVEAGSGINELTGPSSLGVAIISTTSYELQKLDENKKKEYRSVIDYLISCGADIMTPGILVFACARGFTDIVQQILDRIEEMDGHKKQRELEDALWEAVGNNHLDIIKLLLEKGADLNLKSEFNMDTPPIFSININPETARYLISQGADYKCLSKDKQNVLFSTSMFGNFEAVKFFIELGVDPKHVDENGSTPLHHLRESSLLKENHKKIIDLFIQSGVDINVINKKGKTVYDRMKEQNDDELIAYIKKCGGKSAKRLSQEKK